MRPATTRQLEMLDRLRVDHDPDITLEDARMLLLTTMEENGQDRRMQPLVLPDTAMAVLSDGDPMGGRQWEA